MAEQLNERAREHAEAASKVDARPLQVNWAQSVTYWNPQGKAVYGFYDNDGHVLVSGPTQELPTMPANIFHRGSSGGEYFAVVTVTEDWTVSPWAGWKAQFVFILSE
jgi:hypothetical protein